MNSANRNTTLLTLWLTLLTLVLSSCIGTVEDMNPDDALGANDKVTNISYTGLTSVRAISDSKILIKFPPSTLPAKKVNYIIYVNNTNTPLKISPTSLTSVDGQFQYILDNLQPRTTYLIRVSIKDITTNIESKNDRTDTVTTFANATCKFNGIQRASIPPGTPGTSSININWAKADSVGTVLAKVESDPIQYIVYYLPQDKGTREELRDLSSPFISYRKIPNSLQDVIPNYDSYQLTDLTPNTAYHIMVRCIHKGYKTYSDIPTYKLEENREVITISTSSLSSGVIFGGDILPSTPAGEAGKTSKSITWNAASGNFNSYRIYYRQVGAPDANANNLNTDMIDDAYMDSTSAKYKEVTDTSKTITTIESLTQFAYYQFKVAACIPLAPDETSSLPCDKDHRAVTNFKLSRITPTLAPFAGLSLIGQPTGFYPCSWDNSKNCGSIFLNFIPPTLEIGTISNFEIHCSSTSDFSTDDQIIPNDGTAISASSSACNHLKRVIPSTVDWKTYNKIEIKDIEITSNGVGLNRLFFKMLPYVDYYYDSTRVYFDINQDSTTLSVFPQIKVPSAQEFTGAKSCTVDFTTKSISLYWDSPMGGNYNGFEIFIKKSNGTPFSYGQAIAAKQAGDNSEYEWINFINDKTQTSFTLNNSTIVGIPNDNSNFFDWGNQYTIGILTSLQDKNSYSETNSGIVNCSINLPSLYFKSWTNILAIGPKIDGLIPLSKNNGVPFTILETLNNDNIPQEVIEPRQDTSDASLDMTDYEDKYDQRVNISTLIHDGTYHTRDGKPFSGSNLKGNFSRTGIIQIVWQDAVLPDMSTPLTSLVTDSNNDGTINYLDADKDQTGYQVFRSSDNGKTWDNLTSKDFIFSDSTKFIIAKNSFTNAKNNDVLQKVSLVTFTDYSANSIIDNSTVAKARSYLYRVEAFYKGKKLSWMTDINNTRSIKQNQIQITMPPANMALVHRLIANKTQCQIMGLTPGNTDYRDLIIPDWDTDKFYSCPYNGIGASSLGIPWLTTDTVYDQGGDLLIDRFELGCNFSRPDDSSGGCYAADEAPQTTSDSLATYHNFKSGDCLFNDKISLYEGSSCDPNNGSSLYTYTFPGANAAAASRTFSCDSDIMNNSDLFFDVDNGKYNDYAAKSQFAAVAHNRLISQIGWWSRTFKFLYGTESTQLTGHQTFSQCLINLPYDNSITSKTDIPRWFSLSELSESIPGIDLSTSLSTIRSLPSLYSTKITPPSTTIDTNLPIGLVMTANNSKLPPLNGLSQDQAQSLCSLYKVEIGTLDDTTSTFTTTAPIQKKRLLRKKEFLTASLWPDNRETDRSTAQTQDPITQTSELSTSQIERGEYQQMIGGSMINMGAHNKRYPINGISLDATDASFLSNNYVDSEIDNNKNSPIATGSSFYDNFSYVNNKIQQSSKTTEANTSRFGIQDMVGNVAEYSSERIFPKTSGFTVYLENTAGTKFQIPGLPLFYNATTFSGGMTIISPTGGGQASPIEAGIPSSLSTSGTTVLPSILNDGSFNSFIKVDTTKILDAKSLDTLRSGNGNFISFGDGEVLPSIKLNDVLSLQDNDDDDQISTRRYNSTNPDPRNYKYFSPILGLPIACNGTSCSTSGDNMRTTTYGHDLSNIPSGLIDIPINNSQIYSDGLGEQIENSPTTADSTLDMGHFLENGLIINEHYLSPIPFNIKTGSTTDYDNLIPTDTADGINNTDGDGDGNYDTIDDFKFNAVRADWMVTRGRPMFFINGGSYNDEFTGRYSARLLNRRIINTVGIRCGILINTN